MRTEKCEMCRAFFAEESTLALVDAMLDHYAEEHPEHLD